jgi:HSP20 family protein
MAESNLERRPEERGRIERRPQTGGSTGREAGFPSLFGRHPEELFTMSPFTLMRRLTEDMDRMFSGFGGGFAGGRETRMWAPPIEVRESSGNLIVSAELPGLNKEDVKVELNEDCLVIQGERKKHVDEEQGGVRRSERYYGSFYREIPLPEGARTDQVKARFNNGLLEVTVPVPESHQKSRQILIETGEEERKSVGTQGAGKTQTQTSKAG